ncbi:MAG: nucleotidyl transferase AbiEii/AbiGii toxin family protein [Blastochloris sp.]|nr:nucleotidyl transferase AbiEii/AbiGii toxin family protein [Blastochloris sp.]
MDLLLKHQVKFIVCGGVAVGFCGFVRFTEDIDILVSIREGNVERVREAFSHFGEGFGGDIQEGDLPLEPGCVRVLEEDCPVDIFTLMNSQTYEELLPGSMALRLPQMLGEIRHLSPRQLIEAKSGTWREKDRMDVDALSRLEREKGS